MLTKILKLAALCLVGLSTLISHAQDGVITKSVVTFSFVLTKEQGGFALPTGTSPETIIKGRTITDYADPLGADAKSDFYITRQVTAHRNDELSDPASVTIDSSKVLVTQRFGNKELIDLLYDDEVLYFKDGWSLVFIDYGAPGLYAFFIEKKGETPIQVDNYVGLQLLGQAESYKSQIKTTYNNGQETVTRSASFKGIQMGNLSIKLAGGYGRAAGHINYSGGYDKKVGAEIGTGATTTVQGMIYDDESDEPIGMISGTFRLGKASVVTNPELYVPQGF